MDLILEIKSTVEIKLEQNKTKTGNDFGFADELLRDLKKKTLFCCESISIKLCAVYVAQIPP